MPSVSIIMATSSRPAALEETLRSLSAVRIPEAWAVELLLAENGSRSGAESLLCTFPSERFIETRYVFEPRPGKARALNLALSNARGEILLFTDDDIRFPPNWVEGMCEPIAAGRADAVAAWGETRFSPSSTVDESHAPGMAGFHRRLPFVREAFGDVRRKYGGWPKSIRSDRRF